MIQRATRESAYHVGGPRVKRTAGFRIDTTTCNAAVITLQLLLCHRTLSNVLFKQTNPVPMDENVIGTTCPLQTICFI